MIILSEIIGGMAIAFICFWLAPKILDYTEKPYESIQKGRNLVMNYRKDKP